MKQTYFSISFQFKSSVLCVLDVYLADVMPHIATYGQQPRECECGRDTNFTLIFSWIAKEYRKKVVRNSGEICSRIEMDAQHLAKWRKSQEGEWKILQTHLWITAHWFDYITYIVYVCVYATSTRWGTQRDPKDMKPFFSSSFSPRTSTKIRKYIIKKQQHRKMSPIHSINK